MLLGGSRLEMRIRVLSDLRLEFADWCPPKVEADIVVLAGDIHVGAKGVEWVRRSFPSTPVVYVPGNHEFYGGQPQAATPFSRSRRRTRSSPGSAYFDGCRIKRNASEYHFAGGVSDTDADSLLETVRQFAVDAAAWIKAKHPTLA